MGRRGAPSGRTGRGKRGNKGLAGFKLFQPQDTAPLEAEGATFARTVDSLVRVAAAWDGIPGERVTDRREVFSLEPGLFSTGNPVWEGSGLETAIQTAVLIEQYDIQCWKLAAPL